MKTFKIVLLASALAASTAAFAGYAPEGNGFINEASYAAPEGNGFVNEASYRAPEGNGFVQTVSYSAPEQNNNATIGG